MDPKTGKSFKKEDLKSLSQPARVFLIPFILLAGLLSGTFFANTPSYSDDVKGHTREVPHRVDSLSPPVLVKRAIDGDTIELVSGEKVRYIGIDTPEMRRKVGGQWIKVSEPYSKEAYAFNRELVEQKWVRLELDTDDRDRYGRLLAYVYIKDGSTGSLKLVNAEILKAGLARVMLRTPNRRYKELFRTLQHEAQARKWGVWKKEPSVSVTPDGWGERSPSLKMR